MQSPHEIRTHIWRLVLLRKSVGWKIILRTSYHRDAAWRWEARRPRGRELWGRYVVGRPCGRVAGGRRNIKLQGHGPQGREIAGPLGCAVTGWLGRAEKGTPRAIFAMNNDMYVARLRLGWPV